MTHGTVHAYCNLRCRCTDCRGAQARYMADYRQRRRALSPARPVTLPLTERERARARAADYFK